MILEVTNRSGKKQFVVLAMTLMEKKAFQAWKAMLNRCSNPGCSGYDEYGGRGIKVCDSWRARFQNFVEDVGLPPAAHYSLDRTDPNGNYEPGAINGKPKVKWALLEEQHLNRRNTVMVPIKFPDGSIVTKPAATWAREHGIEVTNFFKRIESGMSGLELLRPTGFNIQRYDVGDGRTLHCYEIAKESGMTQTGVWLRINRGIRGADLLKPSRTKHHKGFREAKKMMLASGQIVDQSESP